MKKYLVTIDRKSVRRNPNAGATSMPVMGRVTETLDDRGRVTGMTRDVQHVRWMTPSPNFLFTYNKVAVTCDNCGRTFLNTELQSDSQLDADGDDFAVTNICPHCGEPDCCVVDYEQLHDEELAKLVPPEPANPIPKDLFVQKKFAQVLHDFRILANPTAEDYGRLLFMFARSMRSGELIWQEAWDLIIKEFKP